MRTLRLSDLRFFVAWFLPALLLSNVLLHPHEAAIGALVIWFGVALVDAYWPGADRSPPPSGSQPWLVAILRGYVALQAVVLVAGLIQAREVPWMDVAGLAFAVGFMTGAQCITFAHELGHSRSLFDRTLGWLLTASVNYSHFMVEHYRGHHPRAATFDDPASARMGESLWRFLPRTLAGSFVNAWRLEATQLRRLNKGWMASPLAWASAANLLIVATLAALQQWKMLAFWLGQSAFAIWLLEAVNYIEHYGLARRKTASGASEPFGVMHAWNADHVVSNSMLANLQRHSDHHTKAWKPYPELEALPGPQLPTGYAGCLLLAAVPPVWFAVMHPRLQSVATAAAG